MQKCEAIISFEKEIIVDKRLLYKEVKEKTTGVTVEKQIRTIAFNTILNTRNIENKKYIKEEITAFEFTDFGQNTSIDEIEYNDRIFPFTKKRLSLDENKTPFLKYIFDGGKEKLTNVEIEDMVEVFTHYILQENKK